MVWTIFKKDFRLLWPVAAVMTLLQIGLALFGVVIGPFQEPMAESATLQMIQAWLVNSVEFGAAALAVLIVQQDALVGVQMDWLVRPISRSRLLLAKLLFLGVTCQVPMFLIDLAVCLHADGDLAQALGASAARNLLFFCAVTLPLFSVAALTGTIASFAAALFICYMGAGVAETVMSMIPHGFASPFELQANWILVAWIGATGKYLITALGVALVVALQYFRRKTTLSRILLPIFLLAGALMPGLRWETVYGLQQSLSPAPEAARPVSLAYAPDAPRAHGDILMGDKEHFTTPIYIPFRIAGIGDGEQIFIDGMTIRVISAEGKTIVDPQVGFDTVPWVNVDGKVVGESVLDPAGSYVGFSLAKKDAAWLDRPGTTLIVDYAMTLATREGEDQIVRPTDEPLAVPGWGRCVTHRLGSLRLALQLECASVGVQKKLAVFSAFSAEGERPYARGATQYYAPFSGELMPDVLHRSFGFMAPTTLATTEQFYPDTRIAITDYRPLAHFRTRLEIHDLKLADWVLLPNRTQP